MIDAAYCLKITYWCCTRIEIGNIETGTETGSESEWYVHENTSPINADEVSSVVPHSTKLKRQLCSFRSKEANVNLTHLHIFIKHLSFGHSEVATPTQCTRHLILINHNYCVMQTTVTCQYLTHFHVNRAPLHHK